MHCCKVFPLQRFRNIESIRMEWTQPFFKESLLRQFSVTTAWSLENLLRVKHCITFNFSSIMFLGKLLIFYDAWQDSYQTITSNKNYIKYVLLIRTVICIAEVSRLSQCILIRKQSPGFPDNVAYWVYAAVSEEHADSSFSDGIMCQ